MYESWTLKDQRWVLCKFEVRQGPQTNSPTGRGPEVHKEMTLKGKLVDILHFT